MTSGDDDRVAQAIARRGHEELLARLREAFVRQSVVSAGIVDLSPDELEAMIADAAGRADGILWRRALAQAATQELGVELSEAVRHPAVQRAQELAGAPAYAAPGSTSDSGPDSGFDSGSGSPAAATDPPPPPAPDASVNLSVPLDLQAAQAGEDEPEALRVGAVHLGGIESLRAGERDLELRISPSGLDVLKRSSGAPIGRLEWTEIQSVTLPRRRGLRPGRRRTQELHVATQRGRASFELPGLSEEQLRDELQPLLDRSRAAATAVDEP